MLIVIHLLAITRELCKHDADEHQCKTQTILEFTIVAISNESAAVELNIEEGVAQGTNALDRMGPVQSLVEPIQGAADTSATVIHNIRSTSDT